VHVAPARPAIAVLDLDTGAVTTVCVVETGTGGVVVRGSIE